ncbi:MAG: hypothetical protein M1426_01515 [Patescibacteria group bacterium]|nr:hypothetical protein [Patescibacteria group bacterium]
MKIIYYSISLLSLIAYFPLSSLCAEKFAPGLVTKIVGEYVSINLEQTDQVGMGDTLWVFREQKDKIAYIGLVQILAVVNNKCGAKILFVRNGERIEILDRAGKVPREIDMSNDQEVDNLTFAQEILNQIKNNQANPVPVQSLQAQQKKNTMPSVILFSLGSIGVGVTATYGVLALYHNYKFKYADTPVERSGHAQDYQDARKIRNVAGISTAAILSIAALSHFLNERKQQNP